MCPRFDTRSPELVWAEKLGVLPVRLRAGVEDLRFVLVNGTRGNFCLDLSDSEPTDPRGSAWSANVGHYVRQARSKIVVTSWNQPQGQAENWEAALVMDRIEDFHEHLEKSSPPAEASAVSHGLRVFGQVRGAFSGDAQGLDALQAYLLLLAEGTCGERLRDAQLESWGLSSQSLAAAATIPSDQWAALSALLRDGRPSEDLTLDVPLLLRHAAGPLFQEAHRQAEPVSQLSFEVFAPAAPIVSRRPSGIGLHFTPPMIARSLVQEALNAIDLSGRQEITVFDPACGSGEFLRETVRQIAANGYEGTIKVIGWDISEKAIAMSRFVLALESKSIRATVRPSLEVTNSLSSTHWPAEVDLVLMNPPFVSWRDLSEKAREDLSTILGEDRKTRPDYSFAFILRAAQCVAERGILGSIVPASLFGSVSAERIRSRLLDSFRVLLVGRLGSQSLFPGASVDAGVVMLVRDRHSRRSGISLWADHQSASAGRALRSLRRTLHGNRETDLPLDRPGYSIYATDFSSADALRWSPRPLSSSKVLTSIARNRSTVGGVFSVRQGVLTGLNKAFVLGERAFATLPKPEQKFFRPAVVTGSLRGGTLARTHFVFYPYGGETLESEKVLARRLPVYFETLSLYKERLKARPNFGENWWLLTRPRAWQESVLPRLVSAYFGDEGSFAWDPTGEFAVVQGYAWLPRARAFSETSALAYLAILNSPIFALLLSASSDHVGGGQWNLSARFVKPIPLPDMLATKGQPEFIKELADLGRQIVAGGLARVRSALEDAARQAYNFGKDSMES